MIRANNDTSNDIEHCMRDACNPDNGTELLRHTGEMIRTLSLNFHLSKLLHILINLHTCPAKSKQQAESSAIHPSILSSSCPVASPRLVKVKFKILPRVSAVLSERGLGEGVKSLIRYLFKKIRCLPRSLHSQSRSLGILSVSLCTIFMTNYLCQTSPKCFPGLGSFYGFFRRMTGRHPVLTIVTKKHQESERRKAVP